MEQNKQSAPQNAASEAAVRRQKLADLKAAGHDPFTITPNASRMLSLLI